MRNRHKAGDYLLVSDLSGRTFYASEMVKQWDGAWVHPDELEPRHPQDFVRAKPEAQPKVIRPQTYDTSILNGGSIGAYVGNSTVPVNTDGAAAHLYDYGVDEMVIGTSFIVR